MGGGKSYSEDLKKSIISAKEGGMTHKKISETFGLPLSSVKTIVLKYKKTGSVANKPPTGRPRLTTKRYDRKIADVYVDLLEKNLVPSAQIQSIHRAKQSNGSK